MAASAKPLTTFRIARGRDGDAVSILIHNPDLRSENLSLTTWGSAHVLAQALHSIDVGDGDVDILELGAGTGLAGLGAAAVWSPRVRRLLLTDLPGIVPGLALNIAANAATLAPQGSNDDKAPSAHCAALDWRRPDELVFLPEGPAGPPAAAAFDRFAVIIAADCIYDAEHPEMLAQAIFARLLPPPPPPPEGGGPRPMVIVAYPLRVAYLDAIRDLWQRLEAGGLAAVRSDRGHAAADFDDESLIEWAVFQWHGQPDHSNSKNKE